MGNRLSKIYTRTGDEGTTGLGDGSRVPKTAPRVHAMGEVDELNSVIGVLMLEDLPDEIRSCLVRVQHTLFDLGGELSFPGYSLVKESDVTYLETTLDQLNAALAPLKEFILPGGCRAAAFCHQARSVCRRVERNLFTVDQNSPVSKVGLAYINRLSDLLFVMARSLNHAAGEADVLWQHDRKGG